MFLRLQVTKTFLSTISSYDIFKDRNRWILSCSFPECSLQISMSFCFSVARVAAHARDNRTDMIDLDYKHAYPGIGEWLLSHRCPTSEQKKRWTWIIRWNLRDNQQYLLQCPTNCPKGSKLWDITTRDFVLESEMSTNLKFKEWAWVTCTERRGKSIFGRKVCMKILHWSELGECVQES